MAKSADAFRTISEVADWLETPAHVLRFWESKFSQVKPVKRAGGRRYYRPADMELLGGIKKLLHDDGMTIKGVQKVLREQGVKHVTALSPPLEPGLESYIEAEPPEVAQDVPPAEAARIVDVQPEIEAEEPPATPTPGSTPAPTAEPAMAAGSDTDTMDAPAPETQALADAEAESADAPDAGFDGADADAAQATAEEAAAPVMPSFSHRRTESDTTPQETPEPSVRSDAEEDIAQTSPAPAPLKPADVSVPDDPSDSIDAGTGLLTRLSTCHAAMSPDKRERIQTLMDRLREVSSRSAHGR
jgi:DNA-binding transcriptional MerR regulator